MATLSWLNSNNIQKTVKNIGIIHESPSGLFDIICNIDPNDLESESRYNLPRPIYEDIESVL